jgi:hypothetical protein
MSVPKFVNAGPECHPCGGPLKVTVQSKNKKKKNNNNNNNVPVYKRKFAWKIKVVHFYQFYLLPTKQPNILFIEFQKS